MRGAVLCGCRKLERTANASIAFGVIEKADSTKVHERVSRGNKFRQIVLPALYTVAHEVERSVLSVPVDQPSAIRRCPLSVPSLAAASTSHAHPGYCG